MVVKSRGLRIDKNGKLQRDKRFKEFYYKDKPDDINREDVLNTTDKTVAMASMRKAMPEVNLVLEEEDNGKTRDN